MERVDIAGALAVFVAADRGIVVIKSRKANNGLRDSTAGGHLSDAPKAIAGLIVRYASCSAGCAKALLGQARP